MLHSDTMPATGAMGAHGRFETDREARMDVFWMVWCAMAGALMIMLWLFVGVGRLDPGMVERDRAVVDASATIATLTRANARRVMELLMTTEPARAARVAERIEDNKRLIEAAIATLERLVEAPRGRALLAAVKTARLGYLVSLDRLGQAAARERRTVSSAMLLETTLPALDRLLEAVLELSDWQECEIWRAAPSIGGGRVMRGAVGAAGGGRS